MSGCLCRVEQLRKYPILGGNMLVVNSSKGRMDFKPKSFVRGLKSFQSNNALESSMSLFPRRKSVIKVKLALARENRVRNVFTDSKCLSYSKSTVSPVENFGVISKNEGHGHVEEVEESEGQQNEDEYGGFRNKHLIKLSPLQKTIITVGSGLSSFFDPTRAENIATFGEISAGLVLNRLYRRMMDDNEGRRILLRKPRISSKTISLEYLATLPEGTLGHAYVQFLTRNKVTPDSRLPVRFIEDPELAYVMQRYREVHDLVHTVTGQPTNMLGEVVVKWIEGIQTGLPMCVTGGLFGATRLRPKQRKRYIDSYLKWAIDVGFTSKPFLYIYYEERWEQSLIELRNYICPKLLTPPEWEKPAKK